MLEALHDFGCRHGSSRGGEAGTGLRQHAPCLLSMTAASQAFDTVDCLGHTRGGLGGRIRMCPHKPREWQPQVTRVRVMPGQPSVPVFAGGRTIVQSAALTHRFTVLTQKLSRPIP